MQSGKTIEMGQGSDGRERAKGLNSRMDKRSRRRRRRVVDKMQITIGMLLWVANQEAIGEAKGEQALVFSRLLTWGLLLSLTRSRSILLLRECTIGRSSLFERPVHARIELRLLVAVQSEPPSCLSRPSLNLLACLCLGHRPVPSLLRSPVATSQSIHLSTITLQAGTQFTCIAR